MKMRVYIPEYGTYGWIKTCEPASEFIHEQYGHDSVYNVIDDDGDEILGFDDAFEIIGLTPNGVIN